MAETFRVLAGDDIVVGFVRQTDADWVARDLRTPDGRKAAAIRRFAGQDEALAWLLTRSPQPRRAAACVYASQFPYPRRRQRRTPFQTGETAHGGYLRCRH
jgi:hypothetical protein